MAGIRAFIAIGVEEAIIARLAALQTCWRAAGADIGWARTEGMHLTLKFLGEVPEASIAAIADGLRRVAMAYAPFRITIAGTGGFPDLRHPRVLWAGVTEGTPVLQVLAAQVDEAMATLAFPRETRSYRPHLTLGRVKSPTNLPRLLPLVIEHAEDQFGMMVASELRLMRSELSPQGARYTALCRIPLAGDTPRT